MVKSHIRDYATAAFRFYAMAGPVDRYKQLLWDEAIERYQREEEDARRTGISKPTESALQRAQNALDRAAADIQDLEAVEGTIGAIEQMPGGDNMVQALRMIYMLESSKELERGEISERVHRAEIQIPASEKSIYRWLATGRRLFAELRGLRM